MYQYQEQYTDETSTIRGGKSITQVHRNKNGIYADKKIEAFESSNGETLKGHFVPDEELYYRDHTEGWVFLEGTMVDLEGNRLSREEGWVKIEGTNFDPDDEKFKEIILTTKIMAIMEGYEDDLKANIKDHDANVKQDYNKKNPRKKVEHADDIPSDYGVDYYDRGNELFDKRVGKDVAAKKKAAQTMVDYYDYYYNLSSIFDANDLILDKENEESDRIFYDNIFPNDDAKVRMGGYPKEDQNADHILDLGENKWMATMEVMFKSENDDKKEIVSVIMNLPIEELMRQFYAIRAGTDEKGKAYKIVSKKTGVLAVMMAHEYIHAAQNSQKKHIDIGNFPGAENKPMRKAAREILAYHFTAFPNKKYEDPANDPVFAGTDFVRGETAKFKEFPTLEFAFLIWKGLDYFRTFKNYSLPETAKAPDKTKLQSAKGRINKQYKFLALEKDYLDAAEKLLNGPYKIDMSYTNNQDKFMLYLYEKSKKQDGNFENLIHENPVKDEDSK